MKFRLYDIRAIRFLFVFDFVLLAIVIFCGLVVSSFFNIATYIFGSLLLICVLTQLGIFIFPKGYIVFDKNGIEIVSKRVTTKILWQDISWLCFNDMSYIVILKQNTMEFWYKEGDIMISIEKNYYPIKISKKNFNKLCEYKNNTTTCTNYDICDSEHNITLENSYSYEYDNNGNLKQQNYIYDTLDDHNYDEDKLDDCNYDDIDDEDYKY